MLIKQVVGYAVAFAVAALALHKMEETAASLRSSAGHHVPIINANSDRASCTLLSNNNSQTPCGVVYLEANDGSVHVYGTVSNLKPGRHQLEIAKSADLGDSEIGVVNLGTIETDAGGHATIDKHVKSPTVGEIKTLFGCSLIVDDAKGVIDPVSASATGESLK